MGGTFNPIHNAHLLMATLAKEEYGIDRLLFMPSGNPPHKQNFSDLASASARADMVKLAIADNPDFEYCGYEVEKKSRSYTAEALEYLHEKYPREKLYFIIGADSLAAIETWYHPERIFRRASIIVFDRVGTGAAVRADAERISKKYGADIRVMDAPRLDISSTDIRKRIADGKSVKYMVRDNVIEYIYQNNLYGTVKHMKEKLKTMLNKERYKHSLGVCETAVRLAERYGADTQKAYTAGLLHDCAKNYTYEKSLDECKRLGVALTDLEKANFALIHAPLGAAVAREVFHITDSEILTAITRHTVGGADMSILDKIIYIADMIEPNRDFDGVEEYRSLAFEDLDKAVLKALENSIVSNVKKGRLLHPDTLIARNEMLMKKQSENLI